MTSRGLFIVMYGINNLGKSTQANILVEKLKAEGHNVEYLKYPIYHLRETGPMIDEYLRGGNPYNLSPREIQIMYALNRTQFEPFINKMLLQNIHVVAEDYTGSGLSWGIGAGVDEKFIKKINAHLLKEDLAFIFDGERFTEATEKNHKHETDEALLQKVRAVYNKLGKEKGWTEIQANQDKDIIHQQIWRTVHMHLIGAVQKK